MRARDLVYETGSAILANRIRSLLTILGIVIGIAAVIAITSLIDGMKQQLVNQLGLNLSRVVQIQCSTANDNLDQEQYEQIGTDLANDYEFVTTYTDQYVEKVSSSTAEISGGADVVCVKPEYFTVMGYKAAKGRLINQEDVDDSAMSVVLNLAAVEKLFGSRDADCLGQTVRIGNDQYTVVGTIDQGTSYSSYAMFWMPSTTAITRLIGQTGWTYWQAIGFAREGSDMYAVAADTEDYLYNKYNITRPEESDDGTVTYSSDTYTGDVYVYTAQETLDQVDQTMGTFRLIALAVSSIALLVGGIGIMNMMLTNVTERIREIGLRKSLGARRGDITAQFLLESITLCILGGVFGIAAGYGLAWALSGVAGSAMGYEDMVPVISMEAVGLATGICVGIGILFGYYPARRAAKLDPVESLRYQ